MSDDAKPKAKRLGKGLSALIGEVEAVGTVEQSTTGFPGKANEIDILSIEANPAQPRRHFDKDALAELTGSIQLRGVLQPILVRPHPKARGKYQIIAGERRWRAAIEAGLDSIPANVREADELELLEVGIIENVQRTDLNPIEEAEAYGALIQRFGRTQESIAESVGKSRSHVANTLRLLKLSDASRERLRDGAVSAGHARAALGSDNPDGLLTLAATNGLSVREVEDLARQERETGIPAARKPAARKPEKDVDTEALEADLTRSLGLSVDIRHKANGGELRIRYRDLEQLDDVCRRLTRRGKA